jgi:tRNA-dihydrouridine synthase
VSEDFEDWMKKVKNLAWFMIWRWSFWNPWCFLGEEHLNESQKKYFIDWQYHPTLNEILEIMEFHADKLVETKWEKKWNLEIRKHLVQYLKNFPWVKKYRKRLVTTESFKNTKNVINDIKKEFYEDLNKRPWLWEITEKEDEI